MSEDDDLFARELRRWREAAGLSRAEVGEAFAKLSSRRKGKGEGKTEDLIRLWEQGRARLPDPVTVKHIAKVLSVPEEVVAAAVGWERVRRAEATAFVDGLVKDARRDAGAGVRTDGTKLSESEAALIRLVRAHQRDAGDLDVANAVSHYLATVALAGTELRREDATVAVLGHLRLASSMHALELGTLLDLVRMAWESVRMVPSYPHRMALLNDVRGALWGMLVWRTDSVNDRNALLRERIEVADGR